MKVSINGKEAGATMRATYFLWEVDPGTYKITSEAENTSDVSIVAEAGNEQIDARRSRRCLYSACRHGIPCGFGPYPETVRPTSRQ